MDMDYSRRNFVLGGLASGALLMAGKYLPGVSHAAEIDVKAITLEECVSLTPEQMARRSARVMNAWKYIQDATTEITNAELRATVQEILDNPAPSVAQSDAVALKSELKGHKLLKDDASTVFPPCSDVSRSPQPFFTAPGSGWGSHHAYPGGLATHTALNVASCKALYDNYITVSGLKLDRDTVLVSQILHDLHKPWVFQWQKDGTCRKEEPLAGTGEHHVLSVAESLKRGLSPALCIAQACAHDHPGSASSEASVVDWLKAAAIINGTDAVQAGLVEKDGKTLPLPRRMEGFVTHLADHDWVLSVPAAQWISTVLKGVAANAYGITGADLEGRPFNQFRNYVLSQTTAMRLYGVYSANGLDALNREVAMLVRR